MNSWLDRGDQIPHFDLLTIDGTRVSYRDFWQRMNLVLVLLNQTKPGEAQYAADLLLRRGDFAAAETALVVSSESLPELPSASAVVADRWGEVVRVFGPDDRTGSLPSADDLLEWIAFVRMQCPECPP